MCVSSTTVQETPVILIDIYLVEVNPLPENPYRTLMARLMAAYQLTNIKQVELVFSEWKIEDAAPVS
jgi:hypothetical protein